MRRHTVIPDLPTGYPLSPCKGSWSIVVPVAATNLITNPSGEVDDTGYASVTGTITRSTDKQRHGVYSLKVVPGANDSDIGYSIGLAATTTYTFSLDHWGAAGVPYVLRVFDVTAGAYLASVLQFRGTGRWERRRLTFVMSANSSAVLCCGQQGGALTPDFYTDGWQCTQLPVDTTYIDGDQPGCAWTGVRHASTSRRSAQSRRGGRIVSFDDIGFQVLSEIGLGLGPAEDLTTPTGVLGGALYQRTVARVRTFSLVGVLLAASLGGLHRAQAELHAALSPFGLAEQQPLALRYRARDARGEPMGEELELLCHYTGGLEGATDNPYGERCALQFAQYLPAITSTGEQAVLLGTTESIPDANYVVERQTTGVWHALNGGVGPVNGFVNTAVYGPDGNLYVGGVFTEAYNAPGGGSVVAVNHVAKWDGTSWSALGSGFNDDVHALVFGADGTLYAGGDFNNVAYPYLAQWDGSSWSPVGLATDSEPNVKALAFAPDGKLWIGGFFTNWAGSTNADRIVTWDPVSLTWDTLGTGADDTINAITVDPAGRGMVVAGKFTTIGSTFINRVALWNGQYWEPYADGFDQEVLALTSYAGTLYAGGFFMNAAYPYLAMWNNTSWEDVGGGVDDGVYTFGLNQAVSGAPTLLVGGLFTAAGGAPTNDRLAQWDGAHWLPVWIDLPGSSVVRAIAGHPDGRLVLGHQTEGTATGGVADTTVTNTGTAPAAPIFTITGPGRLESIVNWTTGAGLYFNLTLQTGETLTIDLTPGAIQVVSDYQGNVGGSVLPGSALASWRLLPGENTIVSKSTAPVALRWRPTYLSLQGATP